MFLPAVCRCILDSILSDTGSLLLSILSDTSRSVPCALIPSRPTTPTAVCRPCCTLTVLFGVARARCPNRSTGRGKGKEGGREKVIPEEGCVAVAACWLATSKVESCSRTFHLESVWLGRRLITLVRACSLMFIVPTLSGREGWLAACSESSFEFCGHGRPPAPLPLLPLIAVSCVGSAGKASCSYPRCQPQAPRILAGNLLSARPPKTVLHPRCE